MNTNHTLYFAYGSNLNHEDWERWCARNKFKSDCIRPIEQAKVADFELRFNWYSKGRQGGVLSLAPHKGQLTEGVLFEVSAEGWRALGQKEGVGVAYEKINCTCVLEDGRLIQAKTYIVPDERTAGFVEPSDEYLRVVREGMTNYGIDAGALNSSSEGKRPAALVDAIFCYGTLMRGESRHSTIANHRPECMLLANVEGTLLDIGAFPALSIEGSNISAVAGEFMRFGEVTAVLSELDSIEGFRGFDATDNLYVRTVVPVHIGEGRLRSAWAYIAPGPTDGYDVIDSGDWRQHKGMRMNVLARIASGHLAFAPDLLARLKQQSQFPFPDTEASPTNLDEITKALADGRLSERRLSQASEHWAIAI